MPLVRVPSTPGVTKSASFTRRNAQMKKLFWRNSTDLDFLMLLLSEIVLERKRKFQNYDMLTYHLELCPKARILPELYTKLWQRKIGSDKKYGAKVFYSNSNSSRSVTVLHLQASKESPCSSLLPENIPGPYRETRSTWAQVIRPKNAFRKHSGENRKTSTNR